MIRRLFTRALSNLIGDDPHLEPFKPADAMVEPVVVPELEPDPLPFPPAAAQYLVEFDPKAAPRRRPRHLRPQNRNDAAVDMLIGEMEFAGLVTSAPRHKAVQP